MTDETQGAAAQQGRTDPTDVTDELDAQTRQALDVAELLDLSHAQRVPLRALLEEQARTREVRKKAQELTLLLELYGFQLKNTVGGNNDGR